MATYKQKMKEFADYPKYKDAYIRAFQRMLDKRIEDGKDDVTDKEGYHRWQTGQDVFDWWVEEWKRNPKGQMRFDENGVIENV